MGRESGAREVSRQRNTVQREPLRLWAVLDDDLVTLSTFAELAGARAYADGYSSIGPALRVVEFIEVRQPPPRATEHGPGQHDYVQLGPGVQASLRITKDGRVKLTIPGGELDVTDGSAMLGSGLHEAGARAAQIRARIEERRRKREERQARP